MTPEQRITNLMRIGYSEREAAFLAIAALNSGYLLSRQYLYYIDKKFGFSSSTFLNRAQAYKHLKPLTFRGDRIIYHAASKPLFQALGEENNRNRRAHETPTIKTRLMALDYILQRPKEVFLATEPERVGFFTSLGIEKWMPSRRYRAEKSAAFTDRHFVDKFPISMTEPGPVVNFAYVDAGASSASGLETYLQQYRELMLRTPAFRFVYVGPYEDRKDQAKAAFERIVHRQVTSIAPELAAYFADLEAYRTGQYSHWSDEKLNQFKTHFHRYTGPVYARLFDQWKTKGSLQTTLESSSNGVFSTHVLRFNYEVFGSAARAINQHCSQKGHNVPPLLPPSMPPPSPACGPYVRGE